MDDLFNFLFPFLIFAAIVVVALGAQYLFLRRTRRLWGEVAARTGLTLDPGSLMSRPTVSGAFRNRPLRLYTFTRGAGRNKSTYTAITISANSPTGWQLALRPEQWYDSLGKSLGMKDIEIGDAMFDQRFKVNANPPEVAAAVLRGNEVLRSTLMQAPPFNIELKGALVQHHQHGVESNVERLVGLFNVMSDIADAVEKVAGGELAESVIPVQEEEKVLAAEEAPEPVFASDRQPAGRSAMPEYGMGPSYAPGQSDPFAKPQGVSDDTRRILIIAFFAFDCLVAAGIAAYLLLVRAQ